MERLVLNFMASTNGQPPRDPDPRESRLGRASPAPRYKDFPPGWGHIKVPMSSRAAAQAALTLYAPCARRGRLAQWAASACIAVLGPRALPGSSFPWLPMSEPEWAVLDDLWQRELGAFDEVTGYSRLQAGRAGAALLLLRRGCPSLSSSSGGATRVASPTKASPCDRYGTSAPDLSGCQSRSVPARRQGGTISQRHRFPRAGIIRQTIRPYGRLSEKSRLRSPNCPDPRKLPGIGARCMETSHRGTYANCVAAHWP